MPTDNLSIRLFTRDDIEFALQQTKREGWESTAGSFGLQLEHDPKGCFIAENDGERVGMVTSAKYKATGWIGDLIVPPERRCQGIGRRLMEHCIRHLESVGAQVIELEADPLGVPLYLKLGFKHDYESPRFRIEPGATGRLHPGCQRLSVDDLAALAAYDIPRFGDDRVRLLKLLLAKSAAMVIADRTQGATTGYLTVQRSASGVRLGPWVADDLESARRLVETALTHFPNVPAIIALPALNQRGMVLLGSMATRMQSSMRMVRGGDRRVKPEFIYGLTSGALG